MYIQEIELLMSIFCKYSERCEKEALEKNIRIRVLSTERDRVSLAIILALVLTIFPFSFLNQLDSQLFPSQLPAHVVASIEQVRSPLFSSLLS